MVTSRTFHRLVRDSRGVVVGLMIALGFNSFATSTELDSDPRVFPYNGTLELNGSAYTGTVSMRFQVTDDGTCAFTEDKTVSVYAGRFAVNLGSSLAAGVPACVFNAQKVYLLISVKGPNDTGYVALSSRQRIRPVPFALWSAEGSDFKVDGTIAATGGVSGASGTFTGAVTAGSGSISGALSANSAAVTNGLTAGTATVTNGFTAGSATITNGLTAGSATVTNTVTAANASISGTVTAGQVTTGTVKITGSDFQLGTSDGRGAGTKAQQRALVHDNDGTNSDTLLVNYGGDFEGGVNLTGPVREFGAVTINGDLSVTGNLLRNSVCSRGISNSHGNNTQDCGSTTNRVCFLTKVSMEDIDGVGEAGECSLIQSNNSWVLQAKLGQPSGGGTEDADVNCEARCVTWQ